MQDQRSGQYSEWRQRLRQFFSLNIRSKIILPYLILTLVVAIIGTYVVITLVTSSLDERLTNHLLEAGRVLSDTLARHELKHVESARIVAFTQGMGKALRDRDQESVATLGQPTAVGLGLECLIITDAEGQEVLHVLRREDGSYGVVSGQFDTLGLWMVQALLEMGDPNGLPRRGIGLHPVDQRYYYFTALPVALESQVVGVVVVGTSLDTLVPHFKTTSLADVIIYLDGGRAVATSFALAEEPGSVADLLDELSITPEWYERALNSTHSTTGENLTIRGRWYRLARGPLRVGDERLGVFAVALPAHFIVRAGTTSRNTYALLFATAMACVILVGYVISQRITRPLGRLVRTSRAVAEGHLEQRTGIRGADEIGLLATTFDEMTERLAERTRELENLIHIHKEAAGRIRAILSSIGDGVLLEDLEGNFIPLNAAAEAMLEEMAANFLLGPLRELPIGEFEQGLDTPSNPWLLEHRRFQVGRKTISVHSAAVQTDDGERLGTVVVLRDVTAEVEADQLKDAFIAHVSHELRTPLTAIKGYSDLLLNTAGPALDETQRGFLETIDRHTENLMSMIETLLDFSEMEARGRLGLQRRPLRLSDLVEEIVAEWQAPMEEKGVAFEAEIPADLPLVRADPRRLRWAIINLVRNGLQHTPAGGSVTLRLSTRENRVILDVVDTGVGISPQDQQQLFRRFYRVGSELGNEVRGLGLGLYVTKAIVEAHGGEIYVVSEEGKGSTFTIALPILRPRGDEGTAAQRAEVESEGQ